MCDQWVIEAKERQAKVMKNKGIDEEYAKEWWRDTEEMINDKVACNLDISTMVLQILGHHYVPVKSKNYTMLTDVKQFVEKLLIEDGITVKITMKKLKEIMTTLGYEPVVGGGNKIWSIQAFPSNRFRVGWY